MNIKVNGEDKEVAEGTTAEGLLEALGIKPPGIAVEINREIVSRRDHAGRVLKDGDAVEIIRIVGGG